MKKFSMLFTAAILSMIVAMPLAAHAGEKKAKSEVVMKMGNKLHLFHSGKVDAQKEIAIGDVITVYREVGKTPTAKEVGQVKVLSFIGEHYFEAEIVKGEIKIGDIAKKDATSLLVQPAK
ncbi:hypothetical protein KI811_15945 [Geobacter hydrogenophilus]|uniref:Uncharacterized protein n=1 Tax=Geobacter hydrogenophilus TaxID=40983 RepID=A0A9W6G377_9BACT|nr:hypothetical protein [Geobacter hydrogenophilus]MBT0895300.1 hypothetical protein [Geobacter hydrogenophilus]GLI39527.1 hypothetical protein GHYDROH2_30280 [Geobacter hydrogenophilus]